ncbi:MAG: hypothetical protein PHE88_07720 [Elusimicrobia bacterium]|nr:hypothetical protein [Elusimicrobiota bacterium]
MKIQEKEINGFNMKVFNLNGIIIGVTTDIGPRILYLASSKKPDFNLLGVLPDGGVETSEGFWRIIGGHRLWSSPEAMPRSYSQDNEPITIDIEADTVRMYGNPETANSIQKEIIIKPFGKKSIQVIHKIKNIGRWPVELGCWAISIMRKHGFAIIPVKPPKVDKIGLLPDRHITLWPYTNLSDKRIIFGNEYIFIKQDTKAKGPIKIGTMVNPNWTAYWVEGLLFVKKFSEEKSKYPDFGCSVEIYTNSNMLELETVGPLKLINPSESVQHTEIWDIFSVGNLNPNADEVEKKICSKISF